MKKSLVVVILFFWNYIPYFDPVRMLLIDPMHCLFLGIAKHITKKLWIGREVLNGNKLDKIHERLSKVQVPINVGRLPAKIDSGVTYTAEQWMNWTIYFSIYCLHDLLSDDEIECWRHFVLACRRLCKLHVMEEDVTVANGLLLKFGERMQRIYGEDAITPNMHMACHIAECILDYGPLHSFWLFAFERYNGLLGSQPNNNRAIEGQLMARFLKDNVHFHLMHSLNTKPLFEHFGPVVCTNAFERSELVEKNKNNEHVSTGLLQEPPKYNLHVLSDTDCLELKQVYCKLYPKHAQKFLHPNFNIFSTVKKFSFIHMDGKKISSTCEDMKSKVPYVLAKPLFSFTDQPSIAHVQLRPVQIQYFIKHNIEIEPQTTKSHIFAVVKWPQMHPDKMKMGKPVELWCKDLFEICDHDFLPVTQIVSRVLTSFEKISDEELLVVIPLVN